MPNEYRTGAPTIKEAIEENNKIIEVEYKAGDKGFVKTGSEKLAAAVVTTEPKKEEYGFTKAQAESIITLVNGLRTIVAKSEIAKE